ncbi:hypothetical protein KCP75_19160 [Salmonella enterica subsp. enterica]|nr:hypothetical protein KCP75_19160 [Salmonella enterica subsp. enterica]
MRRGRQGFWIPKARQYCGPAQFTLSVCQRARQYPRACMAPSAPRSRNLPAAVNRPLSIATTKFQRNAGIPMQKSGQARHDKAVCETWRYIRYFAADTGGSG